MPPPEEESMLDYDPDNNKSLFGRLASKKEFCRITCG